MSFDLDLILKERAARLAHPDQQNNQLDLPSHVLVATGGQRYALNLELLQAGGRQTITPVPLSALEWVGITHFMAEFWPVRWLGTPSNWVCNRGFVLFLRQQRLGLLVEEHQGLVIIPNSPPATRASEMVHNMRLAQTLPDGTFVLEPS